MTIDEEDNKLPKGKLETQIKLIIEIAKELYEDILNIPIAGKQAIKNEFMKTKGLTTHSFRHAWKEANKLKLISIKDKEKYVSSTLK